MKFSEKINAYGHENVLGTHNATIEITKNKNLTVKGDCIIGINASKSCNDLSPYLKKIIKSGKKFKIMLKVENLEDSFYGFGSRKLKLLDKEDIVFRKSKFICNRTVLINCTKSAREINRDLIERLHIPTKKLSIIFEVIEINENQL
ncbi:hypothetical protein LCGC14_1667760 [marine sediment metagenome]|uniref:DUF371 domain-containing protein n=1 Tax=marine sediment metagenome TaxID=412755 RepID=A0A0F9HSX6_9ZZZZ